MTTSNGTIIGSPYIDIARSYMGSVDKSSCLASAFVAATPKATAPAPDDQGGYPNFWQVGCTFDTILDYFFALKTVGELNADDRVLMGTLVSQAVIGYQYGIVGHQANWYDDWCWWGIAASKAFDPEYEEIFGEQADFFRSAAMDLWGLVDLGDFGTLADSIPQEVWDVSATISHAPNTPRFTSDMLQSRALIHKGTRNSWARILAGATGHGTPRENADYAEFTSSAKWAVPRFSGGCWQYDFSASAFPVGDGQYWFWPDPNPFQQTLGVFQLTLMQGLYLSFCCSLEEAAALKAVEGRTGGAWERLQPAIAYRTLAEEVVGFLTNWIEGASSDSLAKVYTQGVLLYERTPTYAELPAGGYDKVNGYIDSVFWAGDQALIMGALTQYAGAALAELAQPTLPGYPEKLLRGMFFNMYTPGDTISPYLPVGVAPNNDESDYESGSGIFWRYVLRCCRLDPGFSAPVRADPWMMHITKTSALTPDTPPNTLFGNFNNVAAALGAWALTR